jgi:hypothetical protein
MRYWRSVGILVLATATLAPHAAEASAGPRHGHGRTVYRPRVAFYGGFYWPGFYYGPYGYGPYGPYSAWWAYPYAYAPPAAERVGLRLEVKPAETEVYVDGQLAGTVDQFDGFFQRLYVAPGPHVLELYLDGHEMAREEIYTSPGTTYKIRHEMQPLAAGESAPPRPTPPEPEAAPSVAPRPTPPEPEAAPSVAAEPAPQARRAPLASRTFGVLAIHTQPEDAGVWIDGEIWPQDPSGELVVHLPAGRHAVEIRGEGYQAFSTEVEIQEGETTPLNVKLPRSE